MIYTPITPLPFIPVLYTPILLIPLYPYTPIPHTPVSYQEFDDYYRLRPTLSASSMEFLNGTSMANILATPHPPSPPPLSSANIHSGKKAIVIRCTHSMYPPYMQIPIYSMKVQHVDALCIPSSILLLLACCYVYIEFVVVRMCDAQIYVINMMIEQNMQLIMSLRIYVNTASTC